MIDGIGEMYPPYNLTFTFCLYILRVRVAKYPTFICIIIHMVKGSQRKRTNKNTAASEETSAEKPQYEQSSQEAGQGPSGSLQTKESAENAQEEVYLSLGGARKRKRKESILRTACAPCAKAKQKVLISVKSMYSDVRSVPNR